MSTSKFHIENPQQPKIKSEVELTSYRQGKDSTSGTKSGRAAPGKIATAAGKASTTATSSSANPKRSPQSQYEDKHKESNSRKPVKGSKGQVSAEATSTLHPSLKQSRHFAEQYATTDPKAFLNQSNHNPGFSSGSSTTQPTGEKPIKSIQTEPDRGHSYGRHGKYSNGGQNGTFNEARSSKPQISQSTTTSRAEQLVKQSSKDPLDLDNMVKRNLQELSDEQTRSGQGEEDMEVDYQDQSRCYPVPENYHPLREAAHATNSRDFIARKEEKIHRKVEPQGDKHFTPMNATQLKFSANGSEFFNCSDKESCIQINFKKYSTGHHIFKPNLTVVHKDRTNKIRKLEFGTENKLKTKKVIMLVGATGSGKSTMIDAIFNYMFGIQWTDDYRLKLVPDESKAGQVADQSASQTRWITSYTIHHQPWFTVPYSLTIIDTPGFGDTGGIKHDQEIMEQIRNFFDTNGEAGIDQLDAVGFVIQSALPRLSKIQRYIFDSILSIFGKDIADNIFMLLTFADGQKPQVLAGLKEANMNYKKFYKFNNSSLFVVGNTKKNTDRALEKDDCDDSDDDEDAENSFDRIFWKMGETNFVKFAKDLEEAEPKSLALTEEVLKERKALEMTLELIQSYIKIGLKRLEMLNEEKQMLKYHESDIQKNKHFTYEEEYLAKGTEMLPAGQRAVNCTKCQQTCHGKCTRTYISYCRCFSYHGGCHQCPRGCSYTKHKFQNFKYVVETVKVPRTSQYLKRKYEEAYGKKVTAKEMIEKCNEDIRQYQEATMLLTEKARKCLARLDEIALKPNPLSTADYIDLMIQEEEFMKEPGWKENVKRLQEVKRTAASFKDLTASSYNPLATDDATDVDIWSSSAISKIHQDIEPLNFTADYKPIKSTAV